MPTIKGIKQRMVQLRYGVTTPYEFVLAAVNSALRGVTGKDFELSEKHVIKRRQRQFARSNGYYIKDAKIPFLDKAHEKTFFINYIQVIFASYLYFNDKYDEKTLDILDAFLCEGCYGFQNDKVNVTVEPGDIVIDAGAWIGDFAAYASAKGAAVYAFEPMDYNFKYLEQTAALNKNLTAVKKGISDKDSENKNFYATSYNTMSHTLSEEWAETVKNRDNSNNMQTVKIDTVTIDTFVKENNLERVDFIKASIEGLERNLLMGAQETLKIFAPKLALYYHFPDDPEVLPKLIKQANPNYNIAERHRKLYASVPENLKNKK